MGRTSRQESIDRPKTVYNSLMKQKSNFWPYAAFILLSLLVGAWPP